MEDFAALTISFANYNALLPLSSCSATYIPLSKTIIIQINISHFRLFASTDYLYLIVRLKYARPVYSIMAGLRCVLGINSDSSDKWGAMGDSVMYLCVILSLEASIFYLRKHRNCGPLFSWISSLVQAARPLSLSPSSLFLPYQLEKSV